MQASRASQEAPGFKLFYQANIALRRDSLAKRLTLTSLCRRRWFITADRGLYWSNRKGKAPYKLPGGGKI